jgi:hypothetical protein
MRINPQTFIKDSEFEVLESAQAAVGPALDLNKLPAGVVSGPTLIDFANVADMEVRAGVSLSMLFASRVATKAMKPGNNEDDWLAAYTSNLGQLGFAVAGSSIIKSTFKKVGVEVNKAIIPFLTIAFGGAAIGPIILAALQNLQSMNASSPWITLFDRESRRFNIREMHFAAVSSSPTDTAIRYAIARLNVGVDVTNILFFKISQASAQFDSSTTTMSANNSLMAITEPQLRAKLGSLAGSFIANAEL